MRGLGQIPSLAELIRRKAEQTPARKAGAAAGVGVWRRGDRQSDGSPRLPRSPCADPIRAAVAHGYREVAMDDHNHKRRL